MILLSGNVRDTVSVEVMMYQGSRALNCLIPKNGSSLYVVGRGETTTFDWEHSNLLADDHFRAGLAKATGTDATKPRDAGY